MARLIDADALADWVLCNLHDQHFDALTGRQAANLIGKAIDESPTVGEWVSAKDKLPENNQNVLVCLYDGRRRKISDYPEGRRKTIRIDHIVTKYGSPAFWSKGNTTSVIAWMPLPPLPKEET